MNPPDLPGLPRDPGGAPVFAEPWQARAFALAVVLNERGAFAWPEFAAALAAECAQEPDCYRAWLRALESLLAERRIAAPDTVARVSDAWTRAARNTPHGKPIRLENGA